MTSGRTVASRCLSVWALGMLQDVWLVVKHKFILWLFVFIRDHKLQRYINLISRTMDCFNMYEERSFLRDKSMLRYVIQLLESLNDFDIVLERSLVSGVEWPLVCGHVALLRDTHSHFLSGADKLLCRTGFLHHLSRIKRIDRTTILVDSMKLRWIIEWL